ncbi:putative metalloprotease [Herbihabitans rhizosphaerae]|uniref:Putative metalloprotease n=1 Tax=Herbihabitans rhizosphaerae TaxID=1872711 RepID=A0A4V2ESW6_9PSEU|nr:neutral zinc metallopeptidase [Herbihabitans rhizosphaerae]RZS39003.1 putative metalloprotease [Herbihabitans rhizosphaerae]
MIKRAAMLPALLVLVATACTATVSGTASDDGTVVSGGGVDASFVRNTDGGSIDRLAATVITDVRTFWQQQFPAVFGKEWADLSGGYYSVDTANAEAPAPPCTDSPQDVEGNAFYCPTADVIAWDRAALLPVLRDKYGEASVMLVLAHEMGHAVQRRSGITPQAERADPERFPTILIEAMADCYAGAFVRWVADGHAQHLHAGKDRLDRALASLVSFRDPVGTSPGASGAHGDAFDRVSAFSDGFEQGAKTCSEMSVDNRRFTQRSFVDAQDRSQRGNMPFGDFLNAMVPNVAGYFTGALSGRQWPAGQPPQVRAGGHPTCPRADQGPVALCPDNATVELDQISTQQLHNEVGDYATGTVIAGRYALAVLAAAGRPQEGPDAQRALLCLTGAYTGALLTGVGEFTLSPGDLDESIQVLLAYDYPGRDIAGNAISTGYDRLAAFRVGTLRGPGSCW